MHRSHDAPHRGRHGRDAHAEAGARPSWDPAWDAAHRRHGHAGWAGHHQARQVHGAFMQRAPARWDRAANWWRKAPRRPGR